MVIDEMKIYRYLLEAAVGEKRGDKIAEIRSLLRTDKIYLDMNISSFTLLVSLPHY